MSTVTTDNRQEWSDFIKAMGAAQAGEFVALPKRLTMSAAATLFRLSEIIRQIPPSDEAARKHVEGGSDAKVASG